MIIGDCWGGFRAGNADSDVNGVMTMWTWSGG
jgi:hypothetical protein